MLSRVSILCFAASYAIVLLLEVSRLVFRSGVRGAFMVAWAAAGLLAHSIFLYNEAMNAAGPPLSSWRDWFLGAAWFLMIVYVYLMYSAPRNMLGVFLLPLVLGLIGTAWFVISPKPFARQPASQVWGGIHGTSIGLAVAAMLFGFAAGLMYLRQDRRLKRKIPPGKGLKLPSLEWLEGAAVRSLVASVVLMGIGVLTGLVLNLINHRPAEDRLRWFDPLVLGTMLMFAWLLFAVHVSYLFHRARRGRIIAYLAVASLVILVIVLSAGMLLNSQHGGTKGEKGEGRGEEKIADCRLQIADCKLNDADVLLTASGPLPTFHCALRPSPFALPPGHCALRTSPFALRTSSHPFHATSSRRL